MAPGSNYAVGDAEDHHARDEEEAVPEDKPSPAELLEKFKFYYNIGMYLVFFVLFTIIFYSARPSETAFYQSETIRDALGTDTNLAAVDSRAGIFDYLDKYLVPALWQFEYYNGQKVDAKDVNRLAYYNRVVGAVRVRSQRVKNGYLEGGSCTIPTMWGGKLDDEGNKLNDTIQECYGPYVNDDLTVIDTTPFYSRTKAENVTTTEPGTNGDDGEIRVRCDELSKATPDVLNGCYNGTARNVTWYQYRWKTNQQLTGSGIDQRKWGHYNTYDGSGFAEDISRNQTEAKEHFRQLRRDGFLNKQSRTLFVDFVVYNVNTDLYTVVTILFEMPEFGIVTPTLTIRTLQIFKYGVQTADAYAMMACEIIFTIFTFYFLMVEFMEIITSGCRTYFKDPWNVVDWIILGSVTIAITVRFISLGFIEDTQSRITAGLDANNYIDVSVIGYWLERELQVLAIVALFVHWKIFRYAGDAPGISTMYRTLWVAGMDLVLAIVVATWFLYSFACMFWMIFGVHLSQFKSVGVSMVSLMVMFFGEFTYSQFPTVNRFLGPLAFFLFFVVMGLIIINLFLAVVMDAYAMIKEEDEAKGKLSMKDMMGMMGEKVKEMRNVLSSKNRKAIALQRALEKGDRDGDGTLDEEELKRVLQSHGGADSLLKSSNAKDLLAKYDTDGNGVLDEEEMGNLMKDLKAKQQELEAQMTTFDEANDIKKIRNDMKTLEKLSEKGYAKPSAGSKGSRPTTAGSDAFSSTPPPGVSEADHAAAMAAAKTAAMRKERAARQAEAPSQRRGGDGGVGAALQDSVDAVEDSLNNTIGRLAALEKTVRDQNKKQDMIIDLLKLLANVGNDFDIPAPAADPMAGRPARR